MENNWDVNVALVGEVDSGTRRIASYANEYPMPVLYQSDDDLTVGHRAIIDSPGGLLDFDHSFIGTSPHFPFGEVVTKDLIDQV